MRRRFDRGFFSILDHFRGKKPNYSGDRHYNPDGQTQMQGALQPIADVLNDFSKYKKPYKSNEVVYDLLQPVSSAAQMVSGAIYAIAAPIYKLVSTATKAVGLTQKAPPTTTQTLSWMAQGAISMGMSAVKLLTWPLTLMVKVPLRIKATLSKAEEKPKFTDSSCVKELVRTGLSTADLVKKADICLELHRKLKRKDTTTVDVDLDEEKIRYYGGADRHGFIEKEVFKDAFKRRLDLTEEKVNSYNSYLELFKPVESKPAKSKMGSYGTFFDSTRESPASDSPEVTPVVSGGYSVYHEF